MRKYKKKSKLFILVLLILGISIGYAFISSTLSITGIAGINKNTWDVHWNENSIVETEGSVEATTEAAVTDAEKKNISFAVELELPGDFYEFTADAKNYGTLDAVINEISVKFYDENDEELEELPGYLKYSFTYGDGSAVEEDDPLPVNESKTYKFRIEFDSEATSLPDDAEPIRAVIDVPVGQVVPDDPTKPYKITFNPNGGSVNPTKKEVTRGEAIGELPVPTKTGSQFLGWYTALTEGTKITSLTIPTGKTTYYARWADNYTIFDTGENVNIAFKTLAEDTLEATDPWDTNDTNVTSIERSTTAPGSGITTVNVAALNETPIYAWYTNNTIYWYTEATDVFLNEDASYMFYKFKSMTSVDTSFYTNNTTNMLALFSTTAVQNLDISHFDTSNVTDMGAMFGTTNVTSLNLSGFDTSNVTNMGGMFGASANITSLDLSSFDTSNVTNMAGMFGGCTNLSSINFGNQFDTSNVTNLGGMFGNCSSLTSLDLSSWDTSKVSVFGGLVSGASSLRTLNLSNWDFSSTTSLGGLFSTCAMETIILKNVNTSTITNLGGAFYGCTNLTSLDLSDFDVSHVTSFGGMFSGCSKLKTVNMSNWNFAGTTSLNGAFSGTPIENFIFTNVNTSNITNMGSMFAGCYKVKTLDLTDFDTSHVTDMSSMFAGASALTTVIVSDSFVVDNVTSYNGMFGGTSSIVGGMGTVYDSSHTGKEYAHYDYGDVNPGYFNSRMVDPVTVTFNANGGSVTPSKIMLERGSAIGTLTDPSRTDYEFVGWFTGLTDGTQIDDTYVVTADTVVYAHWLPGTYETYSLGELVYFDPVSNSECDSTTFDLDAIKAGTNTCYKWRVIEVDDHSGKKNIKLQMDHNLINKTGWSNSDSGNTHGPDYSFVELETATANWNRVNPLTYNYDLTMYPARKDHGYQGLNCTNGACDVIKDDGTITEDLTTNAKARMITVEELMQIISYIVPIQYHSEIVADNWAPCTSQSCPSITVSSNSGSPSTPGSSGTTSGNSYPSQELAWLFENTIYSSSYGATDNTYDTNNDGYWTLTPNTWDWLYVYMLYDGNINVYPGTKSNFDRYGIRPVINIEKSKITRD